MLVKTKEQKRYSSKLNEEIKSFLVNYKKRYNLFPWNTVNKVSRIKDIKTTVVTIDSIEYTVPELVKRVNQINNKLKSELKPSYFNYILNGFYSETKHKSGSDVELIYNDYSNQLKLVFKDMQIDLGFCLSALKEINKIMKANEKIVKESLEREEIKSMLGYIMMESASELVDVRDFYLECFNDFAFGDVVVEGSDKDLQDVFNDVAKNVKSAVTVYKSSKDDTDAAKNAVKDIRRYLRDYTVALKKMEDKDTIKAAIKCSNYMIEATVVAIPDEPDLSNIITMLRDEKNKNDALDVDTDGKKVGSQLVNSIKVLNKVCDRLDKEIDEKIKEKKADEKKVDAAKVDKAVKESVISIYKACQNGEITLEEREDLLQRIEDAKYLDACGEEEPCEDDCCTNDEKFKKLKEILYKKCANGEFDIDTREELINKAHDMIFCVNDVEDKSDNTEEDVIDTDTEGDEPENENPIATPNNDGSVEEDSEADTSNISSQADALDTASNNFANALANITIPNVN